MAASDLYALVDSPSMDVSRKDGYAVLSREITDASAARPARLRLSGSAAAGGEKRLSLRAGTTARVLTGARIPAGADAVVAEEFTRQQDGYVLIEEPVKKGKNVLPRGGDVHSGTRILTPGQKISPAVAGLLAAAGHSVVPVFGSPVVGIIGTGDEIVEPGRPLTEGKLYASNIVTLAGWCTRYNMESRTAIVRDDYDAIFAAFRQMSAETDVMITSGGAWTGDRDMVTGVLEGLGWKEVFHRIRMGPGKAVGFGTLDEKPVFILPGGPPSNLMGFLQIALPGLMSLCGHVNPGLPRVAARLGAELGEGEVDWTDFFYGTLEVNEGLPLFHPMKKRSRLTSIAEAAAVASIPEGRDHLPQWSVISVQLLT